MLTLADYTCSYFLSVSVLAVCSNQKFAYPDESNLNDITEEVIAKKQLLIT